MVESIERKRYTVIVATIFRGMRGCSFCHKLDATEHIETFLVDTLADCALFKVALVCSDGGDKFRREEVGDLFRSRGITQGFSTADSHKSNGVAKRARLDRDGHNVGPSIGFKYCPPVQFLATESWSAKAFPSATAGNPDSKSLCDIWYMIILIR